MCIMQYSLESVRRSVMTDSTRGLENARGRREVVSHHLRELLNQWHGAAANKCRDIFSVESAWYRQVVSQFIEVLQYYNGVLADSKFAQYGRRWSYCVDLESRYKYHRSQSRLQRISIFNHRFLKCWQYLVIRVSSQRHETLRCLRLKVGEHTDHDRLMCAL